VPTLQDAFGALELAPPARGETPPATVDEVLNHSNGGPKPLGRDVLACHRTRDLKSDPANVRAGGFVESVLTVLIQRRFVRFLITRIKAQEKRH
jgi:hypothetical protein